MRLPNPLIIVAAAAVLASPSVAEAQERQPATATVQARNTPLTALGRAPKKRADSAMDHSSGLFGGAGGLMAVLAGYGAASAVLLTREDTRTVSPE